MDTYASSLGRIKATVPGFLRKDLFNALLAARDIGEVAKLLEGTWYGGEITQAMGALTGAEALEVAVNRQFVKLNRFAYNASPFAGRPVVGAYLRRWDIENIGVILSAKAYGRLVSEGESFLVSDRETPAGLSAGLLSIDDLRVLLSQSSVEGVANQLVKFGYGTVLLQQLDAFNTNRDIFPLIQALEKQYYEQLLAMARFFQGDEWVVRQYLANELDVRNLMTVLKAKDRKIALDDVSPLFLDGGTFTQKALSDLSNLASVQEIVGSVGSAVPLADGVPSYTENGSLTGFELAMKRQQAEKNLVRMRQYPLSLAGIFGFLLQAEVERSDLRKIVYGKVYGWSGDRISKDLISTKLA
ncbi:MAG: V-type ATPase subunit [Euryarchaeota archaeon]|nr:V-type ATPase subunit [Euryarchaeota archaeon]MDE1836758.1 V-type ATPase subunit [Euryarchaeota archaeon]MDE1879776.1 V-type ATPase subunit [Euryarchaeota archaeon]MDE2044742.1 V-type ATPase subunit [Thermoplasmata archaeon]